MTINVAKRIFNQNYTNFSFHYYRFLPPTKRTVNVLIHFLAHVKFFGANMRFIKFNLDSHDSPVLYTNFYGRRFFERPFLIGPTHYIFLKIL